MWIEEKFEKENQFNFDKYKYIFLIINYIIKTMNTLYILNYEVYL